MSWLDCFICSFWYKIANLTSRRSNLCYLDTYNMKEWKSTDNAIEKPSSKKMNSIPNFINIDGLMMLLTLFHYRNVNKLIEDWTIIVWKKYNCGKNNKLLPWIALTRTSSRSKWRWRYFTKEKYFKYWIISRNSQHENNKNRIFYHQSFCYVKSMH